MNRKAECAMAANQATLRILWIVVAALLCSPRLSVVAAGEAAGGGGAHIWLEGKLWRDEDKALALEGKVTVLSPNMLEAKFRQLLTPDDDWRRRR